MFIKVLNVEVNEQGTGKKKYQVADVLYDQNGEKKSFKVFSFLNPTVFKTISEAKNGDTFNINTGKNDKGYTTWESIDSGSTESTTSVPTKTAIFSGGGRDFETKAEREIKQRYIIRQSSLSNAIQVLTTGAKAPPDTKAVLALADEFVNYVYEVTDLFDQPNDIDTDIPH